MVRLGDGAYRRSTLMGTSFARLYDPEVRDIGRQEIRLHEQKFQLRPASDTALGLAEAYLQDARLEDADTAQGSQERKAASSGRPAGTSP